MWASRAAAPLRRRLQKYRTHNKEIYLTYLCDIYGFPIDLTKIIDTGARPGHYGEEVRTGYCPVVGPSG
jgi:hypothetical protein